MGTKGSHSKKSLKVLKQRYDRLLKICIDESNDRRVRTRAARYASSLAERIGWLQRPSACEWCRRHLHLERHHFDYGNPLVVIYLCEDCHAVADAQLKDESPVELVAA